MKTVDEIFGEMLVCFGERTGMEVDQGLRSGRPPVRGGGSDLRDVPPG